jgi:RNA polymerase sigma-70 factor (ECF subfamily)
MQVRQSGSAEDGIRSACESGDFEGAMTTALRLYGPEILGFLIAVCRDEAAAEDAFSLFSERAWLGIARFEWASSLRTWLYVLARNALSDVRRSSARHRRREAPIGNAPISQMAARVRTETLSLLRTERRSAIARLRDELVEEDRALLVLRVDRDLAWRDVARVLGVETDADITREAARLRKRFQFVKERLHSLARERGLA